MNHTTRLFVALIFLITLLRQDIDAATKDEKESLKGIKSFHVVVESLEEEKAAGLTEDQIQTDVELRLRSLGLKVVDSPKVDGFLYVDVHIVPPQGTGGSFYSFHIRLEFHQMVILFRDHKASFLCSTWSTGRTGFVKTGKVEKNLREQILERVDEFANDFLAVNPK